MDSRAEVLPRPAPVDQPALRAAIVSWLVTVEAEAKWEAIDAELEWQPDQVDARPSAEYRRGEPVPLPAIVEQSSLLELAAVHEPVMRALVLGICAYFDGHPIAQWFRRRERDLMRGLESGPHANCWSPQIIVPMSLVLPRELYQLLRRPDVYDVLGRVPAEQWAVAGEVLLTIVLAARDARCEQQRSAKARQRHADDGRPRFRGLTMALRQVMADMPGGAANTDYLKEILSRYPNCPVTLEQVRKARSRIRRSRPGCSDAQ
jgi:hypothetical protein